MKILMIMAGFFPGKEYGGPPVSVDNFCSLMKSDDCYVVTGNHDKGNQKSYEGIETDKWINRGNCNVKYLADEDYRVGKFEEIILDVNPDILYLQGLFQSCVVPCLKLAKQHNIKVMMAPRGELCAGAFKKKYKKIPYIYLLRLSGILKNVSYQSTSEEETQAIKKHLKANTEKIHFLTNIPSIPKKEYIRNEKRVGQGKFIFLSRIHPKKNLISAIRYFNKVKGNAVFDIYGPIEDKEYWRKCENEIRLLPGNVTVNYCGLVSHDEVHEVFSQYDAFLFPTFSENYGHVIAEALVVGTPVIISDQTPWNDVNNANAGWALPLQNEEAFSEAIQAIIDSECKELFNTVHTYIQNKLELQEIYTQYKKVFDSIVRD